MSMRAHGMRVAVLAGLWLFVTTAVSAQSLKDVEIRGVGDGTRVVLDIDGEVTHKSFTLEKPDRVVLDLMGARNAVVVAERRVPGGPVKSIRVAQFAQEPKPVTRIVADLRQPSTFQVERVGGKLVLAVTPVGSKMPQVASTKAMDPKPMPSANSTSRAPMTKAPSTSTKTDKAQMPPRTATAPMTKSDEDTAPKMDAMEKAAATPNAPMKNEPTKSSTHSAPMTTQSSKSEVVDKETAKTQAAPARTASDFSTRTPAPTSATTPAPRSTPVPPATQASSAPAKAAPMTSTPAATATPIRTTTKNAKLPAGSRATAMAKPAASATPAAPAKTAAPAKSTPQPWASDALATREDFAPQPQPMMLEERPGRRVNLDLQGADIRTVLRTLAEYSGVNIIASKDVQGEVSARIKDAPWRHALESILKAHGFGAVEENGIIRVGQLEKIRLEDLEEKAAERKRDELLPIVTQVVRLQFASAGELQHALHEMNTGRGKIQVDTRTNSLIVSDIPHIVDQIASMAQELDGRTPQVEIVSKLVDVSADDAQNLGINWTAANLVAGDVIGTAGVGVPNVNPAGAVRVGTVQSWGQLDFMLDALARQKRANIVSNPNITTVDNREAKILVGAKIPLIVADEAGNAITQLTTVGIQMRVTPHVNSDKTITLDMHPEVSELSQQATVQGGVIINTSEADTRVIVDDGETAVIGGLMRNVDSEIKTGIPILQDLPGLGWMFRNTNKSNDKRELIIFVTPRLIASDVSLGGADDGSDGGDDSQ